MGRGINVDGIGRDIDHLGFSTMANSLQRSTEQGVLSVARFCYVFPCELQGPAWAVGSYSISQSAGGTSQNIIFKTLRQIGCPDLYQTAYEMLQFPELSSVGPPCTASTPPTTTGATSPCSTAQTATWAPSATRETSVPASPPII